MTARRAPTARWPGRQTWNITCCLVFATAALLACGSDEAEPTVELTEDDRAWCLANPFEHEAAAQELGVPVVGDYLRASDKADDAGIEGLEPPLLAIPSSASEPLDYVLQFEDPADADRACSAAVADRSG